MTYKRPPGPSPLVLAAAVRLSDGLAPTSLAVAAALGCSRITAWRALRELGAAPPGHHGGGRGLRVWKVSLSGSTGFKLETSQAPLVSSLKPVSTPDPFYELTPIRYDVVDRSNGAPSARTTTRGTLVAWDLVERTVRRVESETGQRFGPVLRTPEADGVLAGVLAAGETLQQVATTVEHRAREVAAGRCDVRLLRFLFRGAGYWGARDRCAAATAVSLRPVEPPLETIAPLEAGVIKRALAGTPWAVPG